MTIQDTKQGLIEIEKEVHRLIEMVKIEFLVSEYYISICNDALSYLKAKNKRDSKIASILLLKEKSISDLLKNE